MVECQSKLMGPEIGRSNAIATHHQLHGPLRMCFLIGMAIVNSVGQMSMLPNISRSNTLLPTCHCCTCIKYWHCIGLSQRIYTILRADPAFKDSATVLLSIYISLLFNSTQMRVHKRRKCILYGLIIFELIP